MDKKLKVVKNENPVSENEMDTMVLDLNESDETKDAENDILVQEYRDAETDLFNKKYEVEGGLFTAEVVKKFLHDKAKWKGEECLGIIKALDDVLFEINRLQKAPKDTNMELNNLALEAIFYFASKYEAIGYKEARNHSLCLIQPFSKAIRYARQLRDETLEPIKLKIVAKEQGVDVEN